ncbi:hypothetical protein ATG_15520 [Desulfurococcaceae archaeon AG1]|nr:hypothetical protein ATG_15520 [Desulfurococcaceae archaeon AG1]
MKCPKCGAEVGRSTIELKDSISKILVNFPSWTFMSIYYRIESGATIGFPSGWTMISRSTIELKDEQREQYRDSGLTQSIYYRIER